MRVPQNGIKVASESVYTALWIAPALCGCSILIRGCWDACDIIDGKSYCYPHVKKKGTEVIKIVSMCKDHEPHSKAMYFNQEDFITRHWDGTIAYQRGYLNYPIENPTPAEMLFTYHYRHSPMGHRMPCGCFAYVTKDRFATGQDEGVIKYHEHHPIHTRRCLRHHNDVGHEQAVLENKQSENVIYLRDRA